MHVLKKYRERIVESVYLIFIFIIGRLPMRDFDIWFHLKAGELFMQQGHLQFTEIFSYAAQGRTWYPYEWLFQITVYVLSKIGFWTLPIFIGFFIVIMQWTFLTILKKVYRVALIPRLVLSFIFFVSIYEFSTIRPHVIAYTAVAVTLLAILARIYENKRWLFFLPLVTLIWTNLHSSSFIAWGLPLAYACIVFLWWLVEKKKEYLVIARDLGIVTVLNGLVTISPPLWFTDYRLLWEFFVDRVFIARFIAEWGPISENEFGFWVYTAFLALALIMTIAAAVKKRSWLHTLIYLPLLVMAATTYTASRNAVVGWLGILVLIGAHLPTILARFYTPKTKRVWVALVIILVAYNAYVLVAKHTTIATDRLYFPVRASQFAKQYLTGHVFNDYAYGGYLEYVLYPTSQLFFDGRADVFHCCEMRDYFELTMQKDKPDDQYETLMNFLWNKYDISYVIAPTLKNNVWRKVTRLLESNPNWVLVYWDDSSQVLVRRDGKNDSVIATFGASAATPYLQNLFPKDTVGQALFEYKRINDIYPSARSENAIGYIYMLKGDLTTAKVWLAMAANTDPTFESPYMNLGELAAHDGDIDTAVALYRTALKKASDRGLIYIRLGQLMLQQNPNSRDGVRALWERGVKLTSDDEAAAKIKALLKTL